MKELQGLRKVRHVRYITRKKSKIKKSTAHTLEKRGLEHNCITIALKNTTNYRIAFSCRFENKLIWTKDLESTSLPKYCLLFHISTCNIYSRKKEKSRPHPCVFWKKKKKEMNKTKTHTQNFHKPLFMIVFYRKKNFFLIWIILFLGGKWRK